MKRIQVVGKNVHSNYSGNIFPEKLSLHNKFISDFQGNDAISIEKPEEIIIGDNVVVTCSVSKFYTNKSPQLYRVLANGSLTMLVKQTSVSDIGLVPICKEMRFFLNCCGHILALFPFNW